MIEQKPEMPFEFCPFCGNEMIVVLVNIVDPQRYNNDCLKGHLAIDVYLTGEVKSSHYGDANSVEEFHRKLKLMAFE